MNDYLFWILYHSKTQKHHVLKASCLCSHVTLSEDRYSLSLHQSPDESAVCTYPSFLVNTFKNFPDEVALSRSPESRDRDVSQTVLFCCGWHNYHKVWTVNEHPTLTVKSRCGSLWRCCWHFILLSSKYVSETLLTSCAWVNMCFTALFKENTMFWFQMLCFSCQLGSICSSRLHFYFPIVSPSSTFASFLLLTTAISRFCLLSPSLLFSANPYFWFLLCLPSCSPLAC